MTNRRKIPWKKGKQGESDEPMDITPKEPSQSGTHIIHKPRQRRKRSDRK